MKNVHFADEMSSSKDNCKKYDKETPRTIYLTLYRETGARSGQKQNRQTSRKLQCKSPSIVTFEKSRHEFFVQ